MNREIARSLNRLSRKWKLILVFSGIVSWIELSALILTAVLALIQMPFPGAVRFALLLIGIAGSAFLFFWRVIRALLTDTSPLSVARKIESVFPESDAKLISAYQIDDDDAGKYGYHPAFLERLNSEGVDFLRRIDPRKLFDTERRVAGRTLAYLIPTGLGLAVALVLFSSSFDLALDIFRKHPSSPSDIFSAKVVDISPGNLSIRSGESVQFKARILDNIKNHPVLLRYRFEGGGWHEAMMTREEPEIYGIELDNLTRSLEYLVKVADSESIGYRIDVIREPMLSRFQFEIRYPRYTGLSPKLLEWNVGDIRTLEGSVAHISGESTKPLKNASIEFDDGESVELDITEAVNISGEFPVIREAKYHIKLIDQEGIINSSPIEYLVIPIKDAEPKLQFVFPEKEVLLDESMYLPFQVAAEDDYGISALNLVYRINATGDFKRIELKRYDRPITAINFDYTWDLDPLGLLPDEEVQYFVEGVDANSVSGPGIGRTEVHIARMPSVEDLFSLLDDTQHDQQQALDKMVKQQSEAVDVIDRIIQKLKKGEKLSWSDRREIEQVLQTQREIDQQRRDAGESIDSLMEQIKRNDLFSEEILQKFQEMQELFQEVASEDLKEAMKKLAEALEKMNPADQMQSLDEARMNQEEFLKRIENTIYQLKQMMVQQQIEKAFRIAQEMQDTQQKVIREIEEIAIGSSGRDPSEIASQENKLTIRLETLKDQMNLAISEMRSQNVYEEAVPRMEAIRNDLQSGGMEGDLENASRSLQAGDLGSSLESAGRALKQMADAKTKLEQLLTEMRGQDASELVAAIDAAVTDGLFLLDEQSTLVRRMDELLKMNLDSDETQQEAVLLASDQQLIAEGILAIERRLAELSRTQMGLGVEVVWELTAIRDVMARMIAAIEDTKPGLSLPLAKEAAGKIAAFVAHLLEALDELNQMMNAAGLQQMFEQLQQLAQQQGKLNEMAQALYNQMRKQGRTPAMEEMLRQMALEQQMIREALERLAQKMDALSQVLGDLQSIADEMRNVEQNLNQRKLNEQVIEDQKRILTRMLESEKSLQKNEEESQKRESTTAKERFGNVEVGDIDPELLRVRKVIQDNIRSIPSAQIPDEYRELVRRYYEVLSESVLRNKKEEK